VLPLMSANTTAALSCFSIRTMGEDYKTFSRTVSAIFLGARVLA
jgi:hypothetical protein